MALDFQFPAAQPLKSGLKQTIPITLNTPRDGYPQTVPVDIDWSEYGASSTNPVAVAVDLTQSKSPGPVLDSIRSVYIDNSFSFVPIYVKFPGSEFIVICPANSIGMFPVLASPGIKQAVVYAQNFEDNNIPVTTIHFMNVEVAGWVAGTGEFTPPHAPRSIVNTDKRNMNFSLATSHTFLACAEGTEDATRCIYVVATFEGGSSGALTITGITLGGAPMTLINKITTTNSTGDNWGGVAIFGLLDATGTTADVVVTGNQAHGCGIAVFASYNLDAPTTTVGAVTNGLIPASVSLPTPADGVALAGGYGFFNNSFTGIQNVVTITGTGGHNGAAGSQNVSGAALNISDAPDTSTPKMSAVAAASFQ